MSKQKETRNL